MAQQAYDLSMFEEKKPSVVALKPNKKAIRADKRQHRVQSTLNMLATIVSAAAVLTVVLLMIFARVRITELNNAIETAQEEMQILQSENVRLKGEIAEAASPDKVDAYAKEHGMVKVEPNQIHYFSVDSADRAEIPNDANGNFFSTLWNGIVSLFS